MFVASLHRLTGDPEGFRRLQAAFVQRHRGYRIWHVRRANRVDATESLVVFFHGGEGEACTSGTSSSFCLGDVALLRPGDTLTTNAPFDAVLFAVPGAFPEALPAFLRPDHDPSVADVAGGCATEAGAYRRALLTWESSQGPYVFQGINTHRVRMVDSLSHYHPTEGGHDEFYLVQEAGPGAAVLYSDRVARILEPETVTREEVVSLIRRVPVQHGDLIYVPAGVMHRAVAGVLAHVIAVPGFAPGSEIGLDAHLQRINVALKLSSHEALPLHRPALSPKVS
ncbi:MAG: hypothetical protein R3F56_15570 [Planctomycetota bacterium]